MKNDNPPNAIFLAMKIWSIQNIEAWEVLNREGRLTAKPYHQSDNWPHAYDWMREQMCERLAEPQELMSENYSNTILTFARGKTPLKLIKQFAHEQPLFIKRMGKTNT